MVPAAPPAQSSLRWPGCGIFDGMDRITLLDSLKAYDAALRANGATRLYIFGSRARSAERADSDLDLFIDYDPVAKIPNMFRLMQIEEEISRDLGISVTITTRNALHPLMKDAIERDAIRVL
jgi:predicted nucleotidyltransferase